MDTRGKYGWLEFCVGRGTLLPEMGGCEEIGARPSEEVPDAREGEGRTSEAAGGSGEPAVEPGGSGELTVEP